MTTPAIRRAIQQGQESLRTLAKRYGVNHKTFAKWKKRGSVTDRPTGPKEPRSTLVTSMWKKPMEWALNFFLSGLGGG